MGGSGSGRHPWSSRDTVDDFRDRTITIEIKDWLKRRLVLPGNAFKIRWSKKRDRPESSIGVWIVLKGGRLMALLSYRAGRQAIQEGIVLARSRSGFMGHSWQFHCPGCGRRVACSRCTRCPRAPAWPSSRRSRPPRRRCDAPPD